MVSARLRIGPELGIPLSRWSGIRNEGATLVGVHSFGDYRVAFAELAGTLTRHGHQIIAYDQPGFGATPARGAYASDDAYRQQLDHVVRFARSQDPRRPIVVIAESFGASVAISAIARGVVSVDGLILSGPGVREKLPAKTFWDGLITTVSGVFGSGSVRVSQVSEAMSDTARQRFASDPMVIRDIRADTYERVVAMADVASLEADRVKIPTLVLYGEDDAVIARPSIDALMARLGRRGELKVYAARPHLVLQARERNDVEADILAFLDRL